MCTGDGGSRHTTRSCEPPPAPPLELSQERPAGDPRPGAEGHPRTGPRALKCATRGCAPVPEVQGVVSQHLSLGRSTGRTYVSHAGDQPLETDIANSAPCETHKENQLQVKPHPQRLGRVCGANRPASEGEDPPGRAFLGSWAGTRRCGSVNHSPNDPPRHSAEPSGKQQRVFFAEMDKLPGNRLCTRKGRSGPAAVTPVRAV